MPKFAMEPRNSVFPKSVTWLSGLLSMDQRVGKIAGGVPFLACTRGSMGAFTLRPGRCHSVASSSVLRKTIISLGPLRGNMRLRYAAYILFFFFRVLAAEKKPTSSGNSHLSMPLSRVMAGLKLLRLV